MRHVRCTLALSCIASMNPACSDGDGSEPATTGSISGEAGRATDAELDLPNTDGDWQGDLYLYVFDAWADGAPAGPPISSALVQGVDLTDPATRVTFTVEEISPGDLYLACALDENGDAGSMGGAPGPGDYVSTATNPVTVVAGEIADAATACLVQAQE